MLVQDCDADRVHDVHIVEMTQYFLKIAVYLAVRRLAFYQCV